MSTPNLPVSRMDDLNQHPKLKNPRRVEAGRRNRQLRRGLSDTGRQRLQEAAMRNRPWEHSTGPRTPQGKAQAARNGLRGAGVSRRSIRRELAPVTKLLTDMRKRLRELQSYAL